MEKKVLLWKAIQIPGIFEIPGIGSYYFWKNISFVAVNPSASKRQM
jgi:hypothetical protein